VLLLLRDEPMHGYQLLTELAERSGGAWRPSPGSIYPTLSLLEDEGLVRPVEADGRRVFHLTDTGRAASEALAAKGVAPWETVAADSDDALTGLRTKAHQVLAASAQVAQIGTESQVVAAQAVLDDARRALYALLAQADS
jgi:DNA-binding PadR family transcriptional regulator